MYGVCTWVCTCVSVYVCVCMHARIHMCAYSYMANKDLERTIENTKMNDREENSTVNFVRKKCSCYWSQTYEIFKEQWDHPLVIICFMLLWITPTTIKLSLSSWSKFSGFCKSKFIKRFIYFQIFFLCMFF